MRQNIFLLSTACFYFLMQTANLAFGAPADTDGGYPIVDLVDGLKNRIVAERNTESLEKRVGKVRPQLGQEYCDELSDIGRNNEIHQLFRLYEASCLDNKTYKVRCWEYIPYTEKEVTRFEECHSNEVCAVADFKNSFGVLKTEVYCQELDPRKYEITADNRNIQSTNCSPGITAKPGGLTMKIDLAGLFYSDAGHNSQAEVQKAWIQTNKKGIVATTSHQNKVYAQVIMSNGETAQMCFQRESVLDAGFATFQWGFT